MASFVERIADVAGALPGRDAAVAGYQFSRGVGPAELRARRAATVVLGIATLVYLVANLAAIQQSTELLTHWWWIAALSGRLLFGVALLVVPWFVGAAGLRALAFGFAVFGIVIVAASLPAVALGMPEMLRDQALYAWAAALALRPRWAWAWIFATELLSFAARAIRSIDMITLIESSLVSLTTTVLLVILLIAVLRAALMRDQGERSVMQAIRRDVDHAASAAERARIERIVHDDVLAALRAESLGLTSTRVDASSMANAALQRLTQLDRPLDAAEAGFDAAMLMGRLRALVTELTPESEVRASISGVPQIPTEAALAMIEACGEALRNSVIHAARGREVTRIVDVCLTPHTVEVTVADDGDGFDLRRVPPHRLGIARSIVE